MERTARQEKATLLKSLRPFRALCLAWGLGVLLGLGVLPAGARAESPELAAFAVDAGDILVLSVDGNKLYLRLTPPAADRFAQFTLDHIGQKIQIVSGPYQIGSALVKGVNETGRMVFAIADQDHLQGITDYLSP